MIWIPLYRHATFTAIRLSSGSRQKDEAEAHAPYLARMAASNRLAAFSPFQQDPCIVHLANGSWKLEINLQHLLDSRKWACQAIKVCVCVSNLAYPLYLWLGEIGRLEQNLTWRQKEGR